MRSVLICASVVLASLIATAQLAPGHEQILQPAHATTAVSPGKAVLRVNGAILTDRDLTREMMNVFPYAKQHGGKFPKDSEPQIRKQALHNLAVEELAYQDAKARGLKVTPAKLQRAMNDFAKQFDSQAEYQQYLKDEHYGSLQHLRAKVERAILVDQILRTEVDNKALLSDTQLRAFYQKNPERFKKPDSVSLQTITIAYGDKPSPADKAAARKRAEDALKQAQATKDYNGFGLIAEKVSMDDWRVMMGDHKWLHRGRMPAEVEKVVFAMKAGQMSGIIDTGDSFCIARVNAREASHLIPFEQVKTELRKDLQQQKAERLRAGYDARLRKTAKIEEL